MTIVTIRSTCARTDAISQRITVLAMKETVCHTVLPRQKPIPHMGRQKTYAGSSKDIVAPMTIVDDTHHASRHRKGISCSTVCIAVLDAGKFCTTKGGGTMAGGKGILLSRIGTGFTDDTFDALRQTCQDNIGGGTCHEALAKIVTMLHTWDKAQTGISHNGDVLQLVIKSISSAIAAGVNKMIAHSRASQSYRGSGEGKLLGTKLRSRVAAPHDAISGQSTHGKRLLLVARRQIGS